MNFFRYILALSLCAFAESGPRRIPVVSFSTDCNEEGILGCYLNSGAFLTGEVVVPAWIDDGATVVSYNVHSTGNLTVQQKSTLVLDWRNADESIYLESITMNSGAKVMVAEGKSFYVSGNAGLPGTIYSGTLTAQQVSDIQGRNLLPISGVSLAQDNGKNVATLLANAGELIIPEDISVDSVVLDRSFTPDVYSTLVFPFEVEQVNVTGVTFYDIVMGQNASGWYAGSYPLSSDVKAHKPYLVEASSETIEVHAPVTLKSTLNVSTNSDMGDWKFVGVYQSRSWKSDDSDIDLSYGFAAIHKNGKQPGEFVQVGAGASIGILRAYLLYAPALPKPSAVPVMSILDENVTDEDISPGISDETRLLKNKSVKDVGKSRIWYDLKGRLNKNEPSAKGVYISSGMK